MTLEPKHIRKLNQEIEFERRGKLILKTVLTIILTITVLGPSLLLVILNSDLIDQAFSHWQIQFVFFVLIVTVTSYLYIKWKFHR